MPTPVALSGSQTTAAAVPAAPALTPAREAEVDFTQEVRFAVVLYGGVSLAIYMNGIAQELLHLVRATAPGPEPADGGPRRAHVPASELRGTERVYRKLGQLLRFGDEPVYEEPAADAPIRTRFVIDIISGTSAGAINGVFLAKALANDQSMEDLKALWIQEGDIARLLNDKLSTRDLRGLPYRDPPRSLLNGRRLYRKLLEALEAMEPPQRSRPECRSPYVEELDLFVTATDIRGLELPLRLADGVVHENRYRSVFRFRYDAGAEQPRNDFHAANNPILAFAARCTSAFPGAFEPMRLEDIDEVLAGFPAFAGDPDARSGSERWRPFFADYLRRPDGGADPRLPYVKRAFGDGGYLDNKPFGHAIDALALRRTSLHVDRKLLFIEPSPPDLEREPLPEEPPDALENVLAALISLPRAETIREDVQRVLARNRLIERVDRILGCVEEDVRRCAGGERQDWDPAYADRGLIEMIRARGVAYGGYHRLKVEAVTDAIASLITRAAGFDEGSDQFLAIRHLVRVWRDRRYAEDPPEPAAGQPRARHSQNRFLLEYDVDYRLRRLDAVISRADELRELNGEELTARLEALGIRTDAQPHDIEAELARARRELAVVRRRLHAARAILWAEGAANPLHGDVLAAGIREEQLRELLARPDEGAMRQAAETLMEGPTGQRIAAITQRLSGMIAEHTRAAARECERILKPDPAAQRPPAADAARAALWHYYRFYEDYDFLAYPIFYATQVGDERDPVEVVRISPLDATSLIDEARSPRRKLAGTRFANFGAFLDRAWRENDLLWGRLDGAERLITTLLPYEEQAELRRTLIEEAHLAILAEEYGRHDQAEMTRLMAEALARVKPADANEAALRELVSRDAGSPIQPRLQAALRSGLEPRRLLEFFRTRYEVNRGLDAKPVLEALARATTVIGKMLSDLADRRGRDGRRFAWIARLGSALWRLVEVAVPRSLPALVFAYWLQLLYVAEAIVIVVGTVVSEPAQRAGLVALAATGGAHLAVTIVRGLMRGRRGLPRALVALFVLVLLALAAYGAYSLYVQGLPFGSG
ncbi:MAG TPA: patatin-like protein [Longimicrobiales bacterium]